MTPRRHFLAMSGGLAGAALAAPALGQHAMPWPAKPIRAIVPFAPGLERHAGAGQDAARDRQPAARRDDEGAAAPGACREVQPQGIEPMPLRPAEFDALIAKEIESNKAIVKAAGLKFN